jgi:dTDP-4-amino-4,6-dideoxygalactose transaminase
VIPLLDLKPLNAQYQAELEAALLMVARSGRYILGEEVSAFEDEWARYCGVDCCVATGNALDALRMILMASGIEAGDEVIVPANTYIATWLAISLVGAVPVPVDADYLTRNIDPELIEAKITQRTHAIMPVHLYGRPANMQAINEIAVRYGLLVFADAAQAHGATLAGKRTGGLCDAEAFSFYPSKNLGALGDAGCITTNDSRLAAAARRMRNYGGVGRLNHTIKGINSRMDEMQAAVLRVKLKYLHLENAERSRRAHKYLLELDPDLVRLPPIGGGSCWHQFVIGVDRRDEFIRQLAEIGVDVHIHYPIPPYLEEAYADARYSVGEFPITERLASEVVSLPIGNDVDTYFISDCVNTIAARLSVPA